MKIALITTTIRVPEVLRLYKKFANQFTRREVWVTEYPVKKVEERVLSADWRFFVALDLKSEIGMEYQAGIEYLGVEQQKSLGYPCSELVGWNCVQRRNIALLEALKWGAELIISIDDDNIPVNRSYFQDFYVLFASPWSGLSVSSRTGWFGSSGPYRQRGFPVGVKVDARVYPAVDIRIGVAQGDIMGVPDVDATTHIERDPKGVIPIGPRVVVNPNTHCVFNTQNTAFLRAFAPCMFLAPGIGRYDDIFASLLTQRAMWDGNYHVHFGGQAVWHERNDHYLLGDLRNEIWGMEHIRRVSEFIDLIQRGSSPRGVRVDQARSPTDIARDFYSNCDILPQVAREAGLAWCEDVAKVMT